MSIIRITFENVFFSCAQAENDQMLIYRNFFWSRFQAKNIFGNAGQTNQALQIIGGEEKSIKAQNTRDIANALLTFSSRLFDDRTE